MKNLKSRPCEICSKTDLPTAVVSSTLGAMSNNICYCCSAMGAELAGMQDLFGDYVLYNKSTDQYTFNDKPLELKLKDGSIFKTRAEFVKHFNKDNI